MTTLIELVRKLRNPENKRVVQAIEELRARGWLEDGALEGIRLCHVHMQNADLLQADLHKTDLHQANLEGADLRLANLSQAKLTRANLQGANLSRTDLEGADLFKANLMGTKNLTDEQLMQAKRLSFATMPDGRPYDGRFNLPGDLEFARWGKIDVEDPEAMAYFLGVSVTTYLEGQRIKA
jgi:hypothetical protein